MEVGAIKRASSFCKRENGILGSFASLLANNPKEAQTIAQEIFSQMRGQTARLNVLMKKGLSALFEQEGSDPAKVKLLQTALSPFEIPFYWKEGILSRLNLSHLFVEYPNQLTIPMDFESRFKFFSRGGFAAYLGSTFFTNKSTRESAEGNEILDAVFAQKCFDQADSLSGYAFAVADGAGGHFGLSKQDQLIAEAAHLASKHAVKRFAAAEDPKTLFNQLGQMILELNQEISRACRGEGTTLAVCRTFPHPEGHRLIGFNLGDGMLVGWHPKTKKTFPIFSARNGSWGSAHFPMFTEANRELFLPEVEMRDLILPHGTLLFMMSDGIHELLPYTLKEEKGENGAEFQIRIIDSLSEILGAVLDTSPPEAFLKALMAFVFNKAEGMRLSEIGAENVQKGDDCSLLLCHLE